VYAFAGQPPWLLEHLDFVSWVPSWATHVGGTIPAFFFSFFAYLPGSRLFSHSPQPVGVEAAAEPEAGYAG
jgi:hypothetical protein